MFKNLFNEFNAYSIHDDDMDKLLIERRIGRLLVNDTHSLAIWNDGAQCNICQKKFGWLRSKHHCRLCGEVVCDGECSKVIPLKLIFDLWGEKFGKGIDNGIRICKCCKRYALDEPIIKRDQNEHVIFWDLYNDWILLQKTIAAESDLDKLVSLFGKLDFLCKRIDKAIISTKKRDETKILSNFKNKVLNYVQEKLPLLRKEQKERLQQRQNALMKSMVKKSVNVDELKQLLIVLQEQEFMLDQQCQNLKKSRKFEDLVILEASLKELRNEMQSLQVEISKGENSNAPI